MKSEITLTLKKRWFDLIKSGRKKVEYRSINAFWTRRLVGNWQNYQDELPFLRGSYKMPFGIDRIRFKNGYSKNAPQMVVEWKALMIDRPQPGICPEETDLKEIFYCLILGDIISISD